MAGSKAGGQKMIATVRERYGVTEDDKSVHHVRVGALGGKKGRTGGFYANRELARTAGQKGGRLSKRGKGE